MRKTLLRNGVGAAALALGFGAAIAAIAAIAAAAPASADNGTGGRGETAPHRSSPPRAAVQAAAQPRLSISPTFPRTTPQPLK